MKARFQLDEFQVTASHGPGTPLTQRIVDRIHDLIDGGGTGRWYVLETVPIKVYEFEGPDDLVRPVVTAFMDWIHAVPQQITAG